MKQFFNPKTIALIGATNTPRSVGLALAKNLIKSKPRVFFVNPHKRRLFNKKSYPNINSIREKIDLAVIAVPAKYVVSVARDCARKQVKGVVVISAGFAEAGNRDLQDRLVNVLGKIPLIGPNCVGIMRAGVFNASFATDPKKGGIAFISQSGGLIDSMALKGGKFSSLISIGNEAGMDICDWLKILDRDKATKVICLYIEGLKNGRKFIQACKDVSKPVIVLKGGKTKATRAKVVSHTGALAGKQEIYSAGFRKAGALEVDTLDEMLAAAKGYSFKAKSLGIVSNSGAYAILLADQAVKMGITLKGVEDILGDADMYKYEKAMNKLLRKSDSLIVVQTVQSKEKMKENILAMIKMKKHKKPIISFMVPGMHYTEGIKKLEKNSIPNYSNVKNAILAIKGLNW